MNNLSAMLKAESLAIIGISGPNRFGGIIYNNLVTMGYDGRVYGVNPRYKELYNQKIYSSLSEVPETPDCIILSIADSRLMPVLKEAAAMSVPSAVIFSAALGEIEGKPLKNSIKRVAEDSGMTICGPNGMGFISYGRKMALAGYPTMPGKPAGNISFISHSGSIWDSVRQNSRGINFNYVISSGNELVTTAADYMIFALSEPDTKVLGLFLETVRDPETFCKALELAAEKDIPVVILKVGRSKRGAELAQAHTGALVGEDSTYDAVFEYYGVQRVNSMDEMMDTLELFQSGMRPEFSSLASMLDSGGERSMLVDLAEDIGVAFSELEPETLSKLDSVLEPGLTAENPLDAFGTEAMWEEVFTGCTKVLLDDPCIGLTTWCVDLFPLDDLPPTYQSMMIDILDNINKPFAVIANVSATAADFATAEFRKRGFPVLMGTETALRAIKHLFEYCEFQREYKLNNGAARVMIDKLPSAEKIAEVRQRIESAESVIEELESKHILAEWGVRIPAGEVVESLGEALDFASGIGFPVVLKTAAGATHKTEVDGIYVNITGPAELTNAYNDLAERLGPQVLVQEMVPEGVELILGLVNDPQFGLQLMVGIGGILVELMKDTRLIKLSTSPQKIEAAIRSLKFSEMLNGFRGGQPCDMAAIVDTAYRLSLFARDCGDLVAELDINPLITGPDGAVVIDALIIPKSARSKK